MKVSQAFPSNYLKADDLDGRRPLVTIKVVHMEDIGDDHKPVAYFQGKDKGLVLNKTNAIAITEIAGTDEMDEWTGVLIRLYATKVDFQGRRVLAIRVEAPPRQPRAKAVVVEEPVEEPGEDDEIPF